MEVAINARVGSYDGNPFVAPIIANLRQKYRDAILERAREASVKRGGDMSGAGAESTALRQIENTVNDLRRADTQTFERHIKKLSRVLHSESLEPFTKELCKEIDLDAWLKAGYDTQGSMLGSATLDWPEDEKRELGLVILLIDRFAEKDSHYAFDFAHIFYTTSSNSIATTLQHMASQLFVPFARDFAAWVRAMPAPEPPLAARSRERTATPSNKVFIVHGHDQAPKEAVARYLTRLGFEPIILHEQPSRGRTIIEKIEVHSDVAFAVVLLTADDYGGVRGSETQPRPRARQNVLIELGYFVGLLGRAHVCALKAGEVEVPSDFDGVIYVTYDSGGAWKTTLGQELRAAGFEVDLNKLIQ